MNKKNIANLLVVAAIFFAIGFFVKQNSGEKSAANQGKNISAKQAEEKAKKFISENLVQPGTDIKIKGVSEENNLYRIELDVSGQQLVSYLTKDGENFFPQAMNIAQVEEQQKQQAETAKKQNEEIPKTEKPKIEAFIMSYCPYGTQIQKGLLPVVDLLKDKIDFDFKFVDYAMHGEEEINENLLQYCLAEQDENKFYQYLDCFLTENDSEKCLATVGTSQSKLDPCITSADEKFEITKKLEDKENWNGSYPPFDLQKEENEKYGVQGSPTLVINGATASSARDSQSLLATVCGAFTEKPEECSQELSSDVPAPGFGEGTAESSSGDCGS